MKQLIRRIRDYIEKNPKETRTKLVSDIFDNTRLAKSVSVEEIPDLSPLTTTVLNIIPPPFDWCFVPGGNVMLQEYPFMNERYPPKTYTIPDFIIGKYTITNAQFELFVTEPDGYRNEDDFGWYNFSAEAQEYRSRYPMGRPTGFAGDNLPRTNLTSDDAMAYCRWLSHRTGLSIYLPTEQQWQRAAIGDTGWQYPWGNEFDPSRCCFKENSEGKPVPVSDYENGASPYGALQMSGNVYEWCSNDYFNPDPSGIKSSNTTKAIRGGSFAFAAYYACAFFRPYANPGRWYDNFGFRVALDYPSLSEL